MMVVKTGILFPKWAGQVAVAGFCPKSRPMKSQLTLESTMPVGMLEDNSWSRCCLYERLE